VAHVEILRQKLESDPSVESMMQLDALSAAQARKASPQIRHSRSDPDPRSRRQPDHPSKHSSTVRSASASTLPVTRSCPFASLISIVPTANGEDAQPARPDLFHESLRELQVEA
jgi:hypothetical protein